LIVSWSGARRGRKLIGRNHVNLMVRYPGATLTKREDIITFIWRVDEIAQGACWTDKEWVLTVADLLGGHAAPLARWIRTGLSVGQSIDLEVVVHHLLEAYGDGQTL